MIVGNALSRGNVEIEYVLNERIPFASLAACVHEEFIEGRESLVVSGTHGKTTTTSMLAWIYEVASQMRPELAPSFLIGGVAENFHTSFQLRATRPFVIEGDEYDTAFFDKGPKFMHYFPDALILTHVEFDHADIYRDLESVKVAFQRLVNLVPGTRAHRRIRCQRQRNRVRCRGILRVERYGFQADSMWRLTDLTQREGRTNWTLMRDGELGRNFRWAWRANTMR